MIFNVLQKVKLSCLIPLIPCLVFLTVQPSNAKNMPLSEVSQLSLQELMNVKIATGTLSEIFSKNSPSAITLITQEQIRTSHSRNLASLLEIFVPGLLIMTHPTGDKIGLRGQMAADNFKLLLLINGKNITNMVYQSVADELDQWNLDDIEKIEVIRGPGSVTYGTGAIAGVINLITKKADSDSPLVITGIHVNSQYRSRMGFYR